MRGVVGFASGVRVGKVRDRGPASDCGVMGAGPRGGGHSCLGFGVKRSSWTHTSAKGVLPWRRVRSSGPGMTARAKSYVFRWHVEISFRS